jgi:DNA processing protein
METIQTWFALKSVPGIGNHMFKRLIDRFRSPAHVFEASPSELLEVEGMSARLVSGIKKHRIPDRIKREIDLALLKGISIVTMTDPDYPALLLEIPDPPPYLYVLGRLSSSIQNIAVVGSRNATGYGISSTRRLCADLASLGITVVSGMARGIDTAAHKGALEGKGKTIAVLGSGLERVYPAENLKLFHTIAEEGAVISELSLSSEPEAHHFPLRNRIISGVSLGTVIVEATRRSGSLITARLAAEQGRDVFAVPGSIQSFKSTGTHGLIKQGAKLVEHAQDVIEELSHVIDTGPLKTPGKEPAAAALPPLAPEEHLVLDALTPYPLHIDALAKKVAMEPGKLSSILLKLELKGRVDQLPGKYFSIKEK